MSLEVLVFLVAVALAFDFMNGFHDAANSIATIVSTGAVSPQAAVVWAAFFNFIAFIFFGLHVAATIGKGIVDPSIIDHQVIFGALTGAIAWIGIDAPISIARAIVSHASIAPPRGSCRDSRDSAA